MVAWGDRVIQYKVVGWWAVVFRVAVVVGGCFKGGGGGGGGGGVTAVCGTRYSNAGGGCPQPDWGEEVWVMGAGVGVGMGC